MGDIVESLRQQQWTVGMTGDGVNDAPALKRADCGIAVEGATDAARAAADIVLTTPGLSTIVTAIILARQIFQRMRNYIIYRVACTLQLVCFFFFAVILIEQPKAWTIEKVPHKDYFMIPVFALVLITVLNDGTIISIAYDNVEPSATPERWELPKVFMVSLVLGAVACIGSMIMIWSASMQPDGHGFLHDWFNLPAITYAELQALMYLKISISDFLTVFSARTKGPFFNRMPNTLLLCAACGSLLISTLLAKYWPFGEMEGISWSWVGIVWLYCLVWWIVQDCCKILTYKALESFKNRALCGDKEDANAIMSQRSASYEDVRRKSDRRRQSHQESVRDSQRSFGSERTQSFLTENERRRSSNTKFIT